MSDFPPVYISLSCAPGISPQRLADIIVPLASSGICALIGLDFGASANGENSFPFDFGSIDLPESHKRLACLIKREEIARRVDREDALLLLLSDNVTVLPDALPRMAATLLANPHAAGVNPIFEDASRQCVLHLGTVADSAGFIHYLYEGIRADDPLAAKSRAFQIAHTGALLLHLADFPLNMQSGQEELRFISLPLAIASRSGGQFISCPEARAILHDFNDSFERCGLWNSLICVGKVDPRLLKPDLSSHCVQDKVIYGISPWLNEMARDLPFASAFHAWFKWRHEPDPLTLLECVREMDDAKLAVFLRQLGDYISCLPRQFAWYQVRARQLREFVDLNGLVEALAEFQEWQSNRKAFQLRVLPGGMEILAKMGLYRSWCLDECPGIYDYWLERGEKPHRLEIGSSWPKISVIMPVYNPDENFLARAINSVCAQTYPNWELCMADDASTTPGLRDFLATCKAREKRVKLAFRPVNGHISEATNTALTLSDAPWTAFMDQDDILAREALALVARAVAQNPQAALVFTDEDHIDERDIRRFPYFKPDFDIPHNGPGHLSCYRRDLLDKVGGLRNGLEGSQDFDLFLRVKENILPGQMIHVPHILYHWRVHAGSTAGSLATKPYVLAATRKALEEGLARRGLRGSVHNAGRNNFYNILYDPPANLNCDVILLDFGNQPHERTLSCLQALEKAMQVSFYRQPMRADVRKGSMEGLDAINLPFAGAHWTCAINSAARASESEVALFLDSRLLPRGECRLDQLVINACFPGMGLVGGLLWVDDILWHGGFYPDANGRPFPLMRGTPDFLLPRFCWAQFLGPRKVIGLPWQCFAARRDVIHHDAFYFNQEMGGMAVVDLSLRLEAAGLATQVNPWVNWQVGKLAENDENVPAQFLERWGEIVARHGLRNPNLVKAANYDWTLLCDYGA